MVLSVLGDGFRRDLHGRRMVGNCNFLTNLSNGDEKLFKQACDDLGIECHIEKVVFDGLNRKVTGTDAVAFYMEKTLENLDAFWKRVRELEELKIS
ncbi:hypothetical protein [Bacillus toyonensis]|uniref:hypothetical protein n=1 Tax=Bacillus toyonensis TaxID=155322 RepID=UPI000BF94E1B|nr:hypothetical protein [Bacillus toyonensis]PGF05185.1 hypothetical protein COM61_01825 [Bacillus toyonensis]